MGWNNIWRYVLIFLFLNNILFAYMNDEIYDNSNDISLEEAFLNNLIDIENKEDKFQKHSILFKNNIEKTESIDDSTNDEVLYTEYQEIENIDKEKEEQRKIFKTVRNGYIDRYLTLWTTPKKIEFIKESLNRGKPFLKEIKNIFIEEGLPEELAYLPIIESGFKNNAYSRAKALGPWQFIPHTAKWMGMKMDIWIDERKDPVIAAKYAAKYLKFLYGIFDDWYLALAAYNHGGFNIKKSIKRSNSSDYFELIRLRTIPAETRSYVTSFIAVLIIINSKEDYNIQYEEEDTNYDYITLPFMAPAYLVANNAGVEYKKFFELNPSLISGFVPEESYQYKIRLPKENIEKLMTNIEKLKKESYYSYIPYIIKEGDTLSTIAKRFGVSISIIMKINNIKNPSFLRIGQVIYIPKLRETANKQETLEKNNQIVYTIRKGDTIYSISSKFGITADKLIELNDIKDPSKIKIGDVLRISL